MEIVDFPLAWRWLDKSHAKFPHEVLSSIRPLTVEKTKELSSFRPSEFPAQADRVEASSRPEEVRPWLKSLPVLAENVEVVWSDELAVQLPWSTFCDYWDDFCYPASDDVDVFCNSKTPFLRWIHYEVFEFYEKTI